MLVTLQKIKEIDLSTLKESFLTPKQKYNTVDLLAKNLKIDAVIIKRITSALLLFNKSNETNEFEWFDIGLHMKYLKQNREVIIFHIRIKK